MTTGAYTSHVHKIFGHQSPCARYDQRSRHVKPRALSLREAGAHIRVHPPHEKQARICVQAHEGGHGSPLVIRTNDNKNVVTWVCCCEPGLFHVTSWSCSHPHWLHDSTEHYPCDTFQTYVLTTFWLSEISSDTCSDLYSEKLYGILSNICSADLPDIGTSDILSQVVWHIFWHVVWHSFWHILAIYLR